MKTVRIIIVARRGVFIEQAEAIEHSLKELGICENADIQGDSAVDFNKHYDFNFILRAFRPFAISNIKGFKIIYQTEELWNRRDRGVYDMSQGYDRALEMYDENLKIPNGTHNVVYCPVGYSPVWESHLPEVEEDIDVLFYGALTDRRKGFMDALKDMGLNCVYLFKKYGLERDEFIMRSKIVLNIKAHNIWSYGPMHCLPVQANKKFLMAEKANGGYGPFKPGVHFIEYNGIEDCKKTVKYWLEHDVKRNKFAVDVYNDMVETCNFTEIIKKALGDHPNKKLPNLLTVPKLKKYRKIIRDKESKYSNFNIEPGMATWPDMPDDYKKEWHKING